jgi:hypothetical protein
MKFTSKQQPPAISCFFATRSILLAQYSSITSSTRCKQSPLLVNRYRHTDVSCITSLSYGFFTPCLLSDLGNVQFGSKATELGCPRHVRFPPDSDHRAEMPGGLVRADIVAKVILGSRTKILRAADAFYARRREGPYRFIQNRSRASVVALKSGAAAEKSKDQLSRDF